MRSYCHTFLFLLSLPSLAVGQVLLPSGSLPGNSLPLAGYESISSPAPTAPLPERNLPVLTAPVAHPHMAPELALDEFARRSALQSAILLSYSAATLIRAELPDTSQHGEFEVERHFSAPRTLAFKALRFTGDTFVKTNVIGRLLQSEVDHVQKDDTSLTALTHANYKFSYKGTTRLDGRLVHIYQVKPRKKRAGLFKGRIFLDAHTGSLARAEGSVVKSPSIFIKSIEFVQDYEDVGSFTFPAHIHSEARTRLIGKTIIDIYHRDYQPVADTTAAILGTPSL